MLFGPRTNTSWGERGGGSVLELPVVNMELAWNMAPISLPPYSCLLAAASVMRTRRNGFLM